MIAGPVRLHCVEFRGRLEGGQTRPFIVHAEDNHGHGRDMVLKVRQPDNSDNHFGATSLATELLCSALARAIGLDVPDYAVVEVVDAFADLVPDVAAKATLKANIGLNFGSAFLEGFSEWSPDHKHPSERHIQLLESLLVFDATVLNDDRRASRPNLLWRGQRLIPIDHSLTLAVYVWRPGGVDHMTLLTDLQIRDHCAFQALSERNLPFDAVFEQWAAQITNLALDTFRPHIPASWETTPGHLDQIFAFLKARPQAFEAITMTLRRVVK